MLDLSLFGACVQHIVPVNSGTSLSLIIEVDPPLVLKATVTRCEMHLERGATVYRSGLSFNHLKGIAPPKLKAVLVREIYRAIEVWKANARGVRPESLEMMPVFRSDEAMTSVRPRKRVTNFVWYRFVDGNWLVSVTFDPNQPLDGFAVPADDDQSEMIKLQETYESTDEAGRQLIRLLAHLSIAEVTGS